eukprot:scaffold9.g3121.t1
MKAAALLVVALALAGSARAQTLGNCWLFSQPNLQPPGLGAGAFFLVDYCGDRKTNKGCGQAAADWFCWSKGFEKAGVFAEASSPGDGWTNNVWATWSSASSYICGINKNKKCTSFKGIECLRNGAVKGCSYDAATNSYGFGNTGPNNWGNWNEGQSNRGDGNKGNFNSGNGNKGNYNSGWLNVGKLNIGWGNVGRADIGYMNFGDANIGDRNNGTANQGQLNQGQNNKGVGNSGKDNNGAYNSGTGNNGCGLSGNGKAGTGTNCPPALKNGGRKSL